MKAVLGGLAGLLLSLPVVLFAPAGAQAAGWHTWVGTPTYVFRDATYSRGEFIYTNGIFQAMGANADHLHRTEYFAASGQAAPLYSPPNDLYRALTYDFFGSHRSTHNGDYQLPTDRAAYPDFTADVPEIRLAATATDLYVRVGFTSFPRPDAQVATITFATQGGVAGSSPWPRNAGVRSRYSKALTLWGRGAALEAPGATSNLVSAGGAFRTGDHVYEARIPLGLLPPAPWSITGGSGLADPATPGRYWTVPSGFAGATHPGAGFAVAPGANVWDLLFSRDQAWTFDEKRQADDLLTGDVSGDTQTVDLSALQSGATLEAPLRTGDLSRYFVSRLNSGDGIRREAGINPVYPMPAVVPPVPPTDFAINYHYLGALQPYYMHVPASYATRRAAFPLIVYLHGVTGLPDEPWYNPIGLVDTADANGYLFASALGRGDYSYRGPGDVDVREVIADVERHYAIDPDRVYLMGHSMGGYGTDNVGIRTPDLFAAIAPAEGTDAIALHQNLLNTPWLMMTADFDLDAMGKNANQLYDALSADGYDAALIQYHLKIHEYSSIYDTLPRIFRFFAAHRRDPNPAVVNYARQPGDDLPAIGLVYDHAYWVSGLRNSDDKALSTIRVESFAIPHADLAPAAAARFSGEVDEGGPSGRTGAVLKTTAPAYGPRLAVRNALSIDATNTAAVTLDAGRMRLRLDCALTMEANVDHAITVAIGDRHFTVPAGRSTQTIGSGTCAEGDRGLPNTAAGWAAGSLGYAVLLLAALVGASAASTCRRPDGPPGSC